MNICLIDDDKLFLFLAVKMLTKMKHNVFSFRKAKKGFRFIKKKKEAIDVIICDYMLDTKNGLEWKKDVDKLRKPFILTSSYDNPEQEIAFLKKPFTYEELENVLKKWM